MDKKGVKNYICIFDCESVPDAALIRRLEGFKGKDLEVSKKMIEMQKEENGSDFLPLPFHQIVSICAVLCDEFGQFIKIDKIPGDDEKSMIENFFNIIEKFQPRLVSFNGKNFDMPVLVLRALKHNIKACAYLNSDDKWNNYKTRYSEVKHCDLLESLGPWRGSRLDTICAMAGLPGKYDINGSQVMELFYKKKFEQIHEYCESDTLNTYMLFLKYEFIKGNLNESDYTLYLQIMSDYLKEHKKDRGYVEIFCKACEDEIEKFKSENLKNEAEIE